MEFYKKSLYVFLMAGIFLAGMFGAALTAETPTRASGIEKIEKAIQTLKEIAELPKPEERLPGWLFKKSEGIAIFTGVIKAAYGLGGQYGHGILLIKDEKGVWSHPAFVSLIGGSVGWQIGVQKSDIILVFKTRKSIDNIADGKITLGADVSVSAGPVGRQAEAATDLKMEAEIYSYSKSKGLFAGISIKGASIKIDQDANGAFYGRSNVTASDIFKDQGLKAPEIVSQLRAALKKYSEAAK